MQKHLVIGRGVKNLVQKTEGGGVQRAPPASLKVKMAFKCSFQLFSYKLFENIPPKGGGGAQAPWAPPLNRPLNYTCSVIWG